MKVMLIRPKPHRNSLGLSDLMTCEPLELEYVSAVVKKEGHEVIFVDMMLEKKKLKYFVEQHKPDVVCFTSYITHVNVIKAYSAEVKSVDSKIVTVVGGVHSEVIPEDFKDENIDYVLGINGLENIVILLDALEKNEEVKFKHDKINKEYVLPMPDRELTRKYRKKYDYAYHVPCALLKTSFGCPYNCSFCFCVEITGHTYYERELAPVIEELKVIEVSKKLL